jgi:hypothetical protein
MNAADFLDVLVIAMLALVGGYGILLNRRLNALRTGQTELQSALAGFDNATRRAEETLKRIESNGLSKGAEIQASAHRAQLLLNELSVMTAAGDRIAERIELAVKDVRAIGARKGRNAA